MEIWGDTHTEKDTQTHAHMCPFEKRRPDCYTAIFLPIVIVIVVTTLCICLSFKAMAATIKTLEDLTRWTALVLD